jgi:hypothetical protein
MRIARGRFGHPLWIAGGDHWHYALRKLPGGFCHLSRQGGSRVAGQGGCGSALGQIKSAREPRMDCVDCGSTASSQRRDRTAQGSRRFRCRDCGRQFNGRSGGVLNRTRYPSDVIALIVLWRLRHRLTLQDLSERFLQRGIAFSHG